MKIARQLSARGHQIAIIDTPAWIRVPAVFTIALQIHLHPAKEASGVVARGP
jgi:hypothetical protein